MGFHALGLEFITENWQCLWNSVVLNQGEFEGVLPEDPRRRTETPPKFGAQFWRRIISNKIWRMILAQHLT